jgi:enamine deaminase RidA (YjgF/YER057c/UK114 family)
MKLRPFSVIALFLLAPSVSLAQRGGGFGGGGMGGMGGMGNVPRFDVPELPGPELVGPPDSAAAVTLLSLKDDQPVKYAQSYSAYMDETRAQRDSIQTQLNTMDEKLSNGDRAAAIFYAERATKISKGLKDRQAKWEEGTLFKILSGDQVKTYKKWKKDNDDAAEEKQKRDAMRWNPMMPGGMGAAGMMEEKTTVTAAVGNASGTAAAVRVGRTVYVAGQVALDADGSLVGENDLRAQTVKAFANLTTVLQAARSRPNDVVRLTVYIVNYKPQDMAMIREVGSAYFPQANPPALTVLGVQSLYREGLLISVEATALSGGGGGPRSGGMR